MQPVALSLYNRIVKFERRYKKWQEWRGADGAGKGAADGAVREQMDGAARERMEVAKGAARERMEKVDGAARERAK